MEECGTAEEATNDNIIRCMRCACLLPKATDTECVILIAFPWKKWLWADVSMLRYTYIAMLF